MVKELIKKFIPGFLLGFYHYSLALIGAFLYGFPSQKLTVIGVTGTSGKSTVVELAADIFQEAGFKVASLSSIRFKIRDKEWENRLKMTMPGRLKLQKFLKQAVKAGCKYVVLEVTSEGIEQYRHKFINFGIAALTNLSPEHIESHGGFEKYRAAKAKLFQQTKKTHIINMDDGNAKYFLKFPAEKKIKYGINDAEISPKNLKLLGNFNLYNAITASKIAMSQGISLEICKRALEKIKGIPGRMEIVIKEPFTVIIDYAHTPQSLKEVYETIKNNKRMVCVLGACGGGRDKWKRPVLGKIAAEHCQEAIITNEDPYDEEPMEIIEQVAEGAQGKARKILDRKEAIKKALELANPGDIVIITGKGSEPWMCVAKGKKIPWDDRQMVKDLIFSKK
ncbi:UDP-N-acetylmuramoyl-L-alanyl-D-glutamate--2,6-diaminopimelate ligase [Patescibacteria group bacterium]|nr:UDP-N-acetylmuramoyl-L-alanyl-D-glutamate--2,6-diaminopimelate ligase [Patescibacteria group bacterium]